MIKKWLANRRAVRRYKELIENGETPWVARYTVQGEMGPEVMPAVVKYGNNVGHFIQLEDH